MPLQQEEELINKRFDKLTVISYHHTNENYQTYWKCKCDCGNEVVVRDNNLKSGQTKACGCLNKLHGDYKTRFYNIWKGIKQRCDNPNASRYNRYGGRGISYDPDWENYQNFKKDMYFKYLYAIRQLKIKKPSIERMNNNGNYYFDNCIFIDMNHQAKNTRRNKLFKAISPNGKIYLSKNQVDFCKKHNLIHGNVCGCLNHRYGYKSVKGWTFKFIQAPTGGGIE